MKKSLAIAAVAVTMLSGCQTSTNAQDFPLGPVLGGVAGGFIGNQFGKGTGKTVATGYAVCKPSKIIGNCKFLRFLINLLQLLLCTINGNLENKDKKAFFRL